MAVDWQFDCDGEFVKLLTRRRDVDMITVALELARDAYTGLDFRPTFEWFEARADELRGTVARARSERDALVELSRFLSEANGIFGDEECYDSADSSYLHRVIETKRGIPITLSLLYMGMGERLGIDLKGVSSPMHFLARYESVDGPLFVDAFSRGRILTLKECKAWLGEMAHLPREHLRSALKPVGARTIVIRMLNNLKAVYSRQENWTATWRVQHRLTALQPASYEERRDLALISINANRPGDAMNLLESCLRNCPSQERELLQQHLKQAQSHIARWN